MKLKASRKEEVNYLYLQMTQFYTQKTPRNWKGKNYFFLKLLKLEFNKFAGYKINIQKLIVFLYTSCEKFENEIKKTVPLTIASKRIKYLGINLTKEVQDWYVENYKILLRKIKT